MPLLMGHYHKAGPVEVKLHLQTKGRSIDMKRPCCFQPTFCRQ